MIVRSSNANMLTSPSPNHLENESVDLMSPTASPGVRMLHSNGESGSA